MVNLEGASGYGEPQSVPSMRPGTGAVNTVELVEDSFKFLLW